jgi:hypothetical protein
MTYRFTSLLSAVNHYRMYYFGPGVPSSLSQTISYNVHYHSILYIQSIPAPIYYGDVYSYLLGILGTNL